VTIGKRGIRGSVGIPGTGIRYETPYYKPDGTGISSPSNNQTEVKSVNSGSPSQKSNMDELHDLMQTVG